MVDQEEGFVLTEFFGAEPVHWAVVCIRFIPGNANGDSASTSSAIPTTGD